MTLHMTDHEIIRAAREARPKHQYRHFEWEWDRWAEKVRAALAEIADPSQKWAYLLRDGVGHEGLDVGHPFEDIYHAEMESFRSWAQANPRELDALVTNGDDRLNHWLMRDALVHVLPLLPPERAWEWLEWVERAGRHIYYREVGRYVAEHAHTWAWPEELVDLLRDGVRHSRPKYRALPSERELIGRPVSELVTLADRHPATACIDALVAVADHQPNLRERALELLRGLAENPDTTAVLRAAAAHAIGQPPPDAERTLRERKERWNKAKESLRKTAEKLAADPERMEKEFRRFLARKGLDRDPGFRQTVKRFLGKTFFGDEE